MFTLLLFLVWLQILLINSKMIFTTNISRTCRNKKKLYIFKSHLKLLWKTLHLKYLTCNINNFINLKNLTFIKEVILKIDIIMILLRNITLLTIIFLDLKYYLDQILFLIVAYINIHLIPFGLAYISFLVNQFHVQHLLNHLTLLLMLLFFPQLFFIPYIYHYYFQI